MPRTRSISDAQILDAARDVFHEKGAGATTSEIARRAGVSEGTLFRRFASKEALMMASMDVEYPPAWFGLLGPEHDPAPGQLRPHLKTLTRHMAAFFRKFVPCVMVLRTGGVDPRQIWDMLDLNEPPPVVAARLVRDYLDRAQARGDLGPCNTEVAARVLLGTLSHHAMMAFIGHLSRPVEAYLDDIIDTLWAGIGPSADAPSTDPQHTAQETPRP